MACVASSAMRGSAGEQRVELPCVLQVEAMESSGMFTPDVYCMLRPDQTSSPWSLIWQQHGLLLVFRRDETFWEHHTFEIDCQPLSTSINQNSAQTTSPCVSASPKIRSARSERSTTWPKNPAKPIRRPPKSHSQQTTDKTRRKRSWTE